MNAYLILIILITMSAVFAYINQKFIKMPFVIGLFFLTTVVSVLVLVSKLFVPAPYIALKSLVVQTDISKFILDIMLGFLLFAGSLRTSWPHIKKQMKQITMFALGGVIVSTILIAVMLYGISNVFNFKIDFLYCLLFGAIISPTDPIAVLSILTKANVPEKIETIIVGESLFNDGIGVVIFITLLELLNSGNQTIDLSRFGVLFFEQAVGGIFFGLILGLILHYLIRSIDHYETEILLMLAFVMGGYFAATELHLSGALAMVVMGILTGNYKDSSTMSDLSKEYVYKFWELVDVILNAVLFILVALVIVVVDFKTQYVMIGLLSVLIVLISRIIIVFLPKIFLPKTVGLTMHEAKLVVWSGLRGGLSVAMVLSLPDSGAKPELMIATYFCVLFSILVQGLTIKKIARRKNS